MFASILINMVVIDNCTGRKVGYIKDIRFNRENGRLESLIVTEGKSLVFSRIFSLFRQIEIYKENIVMFGEDIVVVNLY